MTFINVYTECGLNIGSVLYKDVSVHETADFVSLNGICDFLY
jgi:hypothetical protein